MYACVGCDGVAAPLRAEEDTQVYQVPVLRRRVLNGQMGYRLATCQGQRLCIFVQVGLLTRQFLKK